MLKAERVHDDYHSCLAQHDEFVTNYYCSECGKYLGSSDYTYCCGIADFDYETKFCKYCGEKL